MSRTISDLKLINKNLEEEKSSLLTTIRLIQSDYSQSSTKLREREVEKEKPATWKVSKQSTRSKVSFSQAGENTPETSNQYAILSGSDANAQQLQVPLKLHGSEQNQRTRQQHTVMDVSPQNTTAYTENHEMQSQVQNNSTQLQTPMQPHGSKQRQEDPIPTRDGSLKTRITKTRPRVVVLGDSMIKHINPRQLQNGVKPKVAVKTFPGATISDMSHYAKPTLSTAPDEIILHIGTNDLKAKTPEAVVNAAVDLGESITQQNKDIKVTFSEIITRTDDESLTRKVNLYNSLLAKVCIERNWKLISNSNINKSHINSYGLHLNKNGTSILAKNFKHFLNKHYSI